jgi:hypothetical protein
LSEGFAFFRFVALDFPSFICSCGFGGMRTIAAMMAAASMGIEGGFAVDMKDRLRPFYAALGEMVVNWNQAESTLTMILVALCGANPKTWILTAELGGVGLQNALLSASADLAPDHLKKHIDHAVEWYSRLREVRNYYVHGTQRVTVGDDGAFGLIGQVSAKSVLMIHQESLSQKRVEDLTRQIKEFVEFASGVEFYVAAEPKTAFSDGSPLPPLPQMPPLPSKMVKPRRYLKGDISPRPKLQSHSKPKPQSPKPQRRRPVP